jgi:hypothetical protein
MTNSLRSAVLVGRLPEHCSELCHDLLFRLLDKKPTRLGARGALEVCTHPFFASFDWAALRAGTLPPPLLPSSDAINAGDIRQAGGINDADGDCTVARHRDSSHSISLVRTRKPSFCSPPH